MKPVPRNYQELAVVSGLASLEKGKPEIIVSPTGSGKSVIISELCHRLNDDVLILQPSKEILEQNYAKLSSYGIDDISMFSASVGVKEISKYTYATIGSIKDRSALFKHFKYILVDECDGVGESKSMYRQFFKNLPKARVLGLTATPYRMQQRFYQEGGFGYYTAMLRVQTQIHPPYFKGFSFKINIGRLMEERFLAPVEYFEKQNIDISRIPVNSTGADFDERQLDDWLNTPDNVRKLVAAIAEEDPYTPNNLIFCSSIRHARTTAEELAKAGFDCEVVTGNDPHRERKIADFRAGRIRRLLNAKVMGIGFDMPSLNMVTLGMPTMSLRQLYQFVGRSLRTDPNDPGKVARIVDVCNNIRRLGRIETIRITQNPLTRKDQIETNVGIISDKPLFKFRVTNQQHLNRMQ